MFEGILKKTYVCVLSFDSYLLASDTQQDNGHEFLL